jgi:glucokinase
MAETRYYVGLDVGGTTMKAAVVDDHGKPSPHVTLPTEPFKGQDHGLATMAQAVRAAVQAAGLELDQISAIGVATPGPMDIPAGLILDPANLKPWLNVPVKQFISDEFGIPTAFQNDANAAAYGEYWVGAGREAASMVLFTLGTGVGGGIIIDDVVLEGRHSHGGEVGHICIDWRDGRLCGCGKKGCLETYASATAVVRRAHEALSADQKPSMLRKLEAEDLSSRAVFDAAYAGDELALRIVDETAFFLALGAKNLMHTIDPDVVVFAGGMTAAGPPFLERIKYHIHHEALPVPAARTEVRFSTLGSDAGFLGAAGCGRLLVKKGAA